VPGLSNLIKTALLIQTFRKFVNYRRIIFKNYADKQIHSLYHQGVDNPLSIVTGTEEEKVFSILQKL